MRYTSTKDGVSLAWRRSGSGPPLVKAANWLTHLEHDHESPVWSHWLEFLEGSFDYLRYDERGCGLSERRVGNLTIENWVSDFERVIDASSMEAPFNILAMSQGTAAAVRYAAEYPERVSKLVIFGGYARGVFKRGDDKASSLYRAVIDVFRLGWDETNPAFNSVFTSRFIPDGTPEQMEWFGAMCRKAIQPDLVTTLLEERGEIDVTEYLDCVQCPTLIIHCDGDQISPVEESKLMASRIPDSELVILPSRNHILQKHESAWSDYKEHMKRFLGAESVKIDALSPRETEILKLICAAKSNKEIALALDVSEKTVRNHATKVFAKLGVGSRQEAILAVGSKYSLR